MSTSSLVKRTARAGWPWVVFVNPRFNAGFNGKEFAKLTALIPTFPTADFGQVRVIRMPDFADGVPLVPGGESTQGGVTLSVPSEAVVDHDVLAYTESERVLRGAVLNVTAYPASEFPAVPASLAIEVLIVAMPLGTHICPGAELRFDNVAGWAPGAAVDLYLNGAKVFEHYAPYGEWAIVAEAVVTPDGTEVVTSSGVEVLGTFGAALR